MDDPPIDVSTVVHGDHLTVKVSGEIDTFTAQVLADEFHTAYTAAKPGQVVVDLAGVDFCDAAGARELTSLADVVAAQGGTFQLRQVHPQIVWLLDQLGVGYLRSCPSSPGP
ncbi:STAS domain-containing protein [Actinoplanes sp. NPDC024001]|uniref:STAS domain-containing protein n=1 Tax=Actinoplanes sp. NPDC024001 TaxID=3154598 RepID=UPI0033F54014